MTVIEGKVHGFSMSFLIRSHSVLKISPETSWFIASRVGGCDLQAEFCSLLSKELDLLLAVSLFVVLSAPVDVLLTVFQHAIG